MARASLIAVCCAALAGAVSHSGGPAHTGAVNPASAQGRSGASAPGERQPCAERPTVTSAPNRGVTLECARLPRDLVPADSEAAAWHLGGNRALVVWRTDGPASGLGIWRRSHGTWVRLLERRRSTSLHYGISLDDVTGDGRTDVLATEASGGSGGCGTRVAFRVEADRAAPLFSRYTCEIDSELRDGLLLFREPVGDCPSRRRAVHCYGGVRLTIRGWAGRRLVVDRTLVRCLRSWLQPNRGCRRR